MYRVINCFSSYREVHPTLRSMVTLGSHDHEESQVRSKSPGTPNPLTLKLIHPRTSLSLSDLSLQARNSETVWIQFFSDKPRPFSNEVLSLSGKALHELTAQHFDGDPSSFWISCASKPIPPSSSSFVKLGIAPGSNVVVHTSGKGGSLIQRSLDYFLASSLAPPQDCVPSRCSAGTAPR